MEELTRMRKNTQPINFGEFVLANMVSNQGSRL